MDILPLVPEPRTYKYKLHGLVRTILGLSDDENAVIDVVRMSQMGMTAAKIARISHVSRKQTNRILKNFESRKIVIRTIRPNHHDFWRFNKLVSRLQPPPIEHD